MQTRNPLRIDVEFTPDFQLMWPASMGRAGMEWSPREKSFLFAADGKNADTNGDPALRPATYAAGEALFAANDPARMIARTEGPVFQPELPFERSGQYAAGTTFAEGLVFFRNRYFLYYGWADSFVGVAVSGD